LPNSILFHPEKHLYGVHALETRWIANSRLLETAILILKKKYDQSKNFKDFLEETKGTSMIITIDLKTDFYRIMEYFEKIFSDMKQRNSKD